MKHPILGSRKHFIIFSLVLIFLILLHTAVLGQFAGVGSPAGVFDAIVFSGLLFVLGIGVWYLIRFMKVLENQKVLLFINHLLAGIVLVVIWLLTGYFILYRIFDDYPRYLKFLRISLPWRFLFGMLVYSLFVVIYYLTESYREYSEKLIQESRLKQLIQETELSLLKAQISPHFLFNTLNSLNALVTADPVKAREMIVALSEFLRYSLQGNKDELVTLGQEIQIINLYVNLEKIRFGDRLRVEWNIAERCTGIHIPRMVLQPLFENAIKHGLKDTTGEVVIRCFIEMRDPYMTITLENNLNNYPTRDIIPGIGLSNVIRRMAIQYQRNDLVHFKNNGDRFVVTLLIPLKSVMISGEKN